MQEAIMEFLNTIGLIMVIHIIRTIIAGIIFAIITFFIICFIIKKIKNQTNKEAKILKDKLLKNEEIRLRNEKIHLENQKRRRLSC